MNSHDAHPVRAHGPGVHDLSAQSLALRKLLSRAVAPTMEMAAYEALWLNEAASFKTIADLFRNNPSSLPSELVSKDIARQVLPELLTRLNDKAEGFGVRVHGSTEYPLKLRVAKNPIEFFYFRGWWDLVNSPKSVAVVGSRSPSEEGTRRARKLVRMLVEQDFTIYSGLAAGIDTVAHTTALEASGRTVAVIGTPITEAYPRENEELQQRLSREMLVVSQVPVLRYARQTWRGNRLFFPERNVTMSALTDATIIVEAGETSGTLTQARAALAQGRKLFILDNCFQNPKLTWPQKFAERGAIRVSEFRDIEAALG